jgi:D-sedoheptulose 7-phosphate isomerase
MNFFQEYAAEVKQTLNHLPWENLDVMVNLLHVARMEGRQILMMGNGGSASTASHMACDLSKNTAIPGLPRFRALSLNDNMAILSAHANDNGYENVFAEQLINLLRPGDIVVAISASGNSPNVLKAIELAKQHGAITIGWSGYEGGKLAQLVDLSIVVRNHCIEQIEDIHLMLEHMVVQALRRLVQNHPFKLQEVVAVERV